MSILIQEGEQDNQKPLLSQIGASGPNVYAWEARLFDSKKLFCQTVCILLLERDIAEPL